MRIEHPTKTATTDRHGAVPATICEAFQRTAERHADRPALRTYGGGLELTWREYGDRVRKLAAGLAGLGIGRGDTVAMMLTNRPAAFVVDTAALHAGATPFSIYNTSSVDQIAYLLAHAKTRVAVVERAFLEQVQSARQALPLLEHVFVVDGEPGLDRLAAAAQPGFDFEASWRAVSEDDVAVLIYTSGTTGPPKGVELTHRNLRACWESTSAVLPIPDAGRVMSYLPMAHLADRATAHYAAMYTGSTITCVIDPRQAVAALPDVRPTYWLGVPRIWEKLRTALEVRFNREADEARRAAILGALDAAVTKVRLEAAGEDVPDALAEACRQAEVALFAPLREHLGLDQVRFVVSGAAPIGADTLEFFAAIGLPICEGWGMSESTAIATMCPPDGIRIGSVGPAVPGVEVALASDGELLIRGPNVMRGYRDDPQRTAEAIDADGWLHTGDIGTIDEDGYVRIVDRKKELIVNAAGKNMSPANIENTIKRESTLIGPVVAIGDSRPYNTALIVLDPEAAQAFATANGVAGASIAELAASDLVHAEIAAAVERANEHLSRAEQIKRFTILPVDWPPGGDELTPTMKLRRKPIAEKYAAEIESMYEAA